MKPAKMEPMSEIEGRLAHSGSVAQPGCHTCIQPCKPDNPFPPPPSRALFMKLNDIQMHVWEANHSDNLYLKCKGAEKHHRLVSALGIEKKAPSRRLDCALSGPRPPASVAKDLEK